MQPICLAKFPLGEGFSQTNKQTDRLRSTMEVEIFTLYYSDTVNDMTVMTIFMSIEYEPFLQTLSLTSSQAHQSLTVF